MGQKAEGAEVDAQDGHVTVGARRVNDRAVAADHHLHVGASQVVGVGLAFFEPGAHFFGERHRFRLARIDDHAQAPRPRVRLSPVARLLHR